jgi:NAD binding domain of 6-phosphogluconate dehydrogenase
VEIRGWNSLSARRRTIRHGCNHLGKKQTRIIGIGYMGRPIAQRLLKAGFRLTAYDRHRTKAEELIRSGGTVAENVGGLSSNCYVVLSCLASDEAVLSIYKGAEGAFANAHRGSLVIDLSTVNPQTSQELSRLGSARGVGVLDVTISGSTPAAEQGALTLFGGGDQGCFAAAESIYPEPCSEVIVSGRSGSRNPTMACVRPSEPASTAFEIQISDWPALRRKSLLAPVLMPRLHQALPFWEMSRPALR